MSDTISFKEITRIVEHTCKVLAKDGTEDTIADALDALEDLRETIGEYEDILLDTQSELMMKRMDLEEGLFDV